jgi:anaerobic selenocysteine-containing dehydrogenase
LERLDREHFVRLNVAADGHPFLPFAQGGFGTPSGKCEFGAEKLDYQPPVESRLGATELRSRYPLELISAKSDDSMNSTFGNHPSARSQTSLVFLNETDARPRGISTGDRVRVYNGRGSCLFNADVNGTVRQGVAWAPSVRWNKLSPDGHNVNVLTSDRLTDLGGGPTFYSCLVEVEKCGD